MAPDKIITVYHKKSGAHIKSSMYINEFGSYCQYDEIHQYVKNNNVKFFIKPHPGLSAERFEESHYLMQLLKSVEPMNNVHSSKQVNFLNRVIRGGGFVEYIEKLEGNLNESR